jgi:hypothetical protein
MPILANKQSMVRTTPSPDTWVRPTDWVEMPDLTSADTKIYAVYAVYETRKNPASLSFVMTPSYGGTISWGDGSTTALNDGSTKSKTYVYSSITSSVLTDEYNQKYKTVLITVTPSVGNITLSNFGTSNVGVANFLDVVMSTPNGGAQFPKGAPLLQRFKMLSGTFTGLNISAYFNALNSCRIFEIPPILGNPTAMASTFQFIGNAEVGNITTTGNISLSNGLSNSLIRKIGNFTNTSSTTTSAVFSGNYNLKEIGNVVLPAATSMNSMFFYNMSLIKTGLITSTSTTSINSMFFYCNKLRETSFSDLTNVTNTSNAFFTCYSLENIRVPGLKVSVNFTDCAMERAALVQVFNDLGTAATTQTITVTRNPGSADLTAADILIATSKNWTVTL